ncbi:MULTISPECIES: aa3-type cytochrome c oxidase subunit IV [Sphingomonadaceae]|uniref:Aa3-type cytochrome c oxidase subunit IV n=1 Tax=Novosphingobium clariflavum TaxID=2029884 RepID=A0ABV6SDA2_9SPHN|nr:MULTISPECIES: aa3-type cytochrome c oxidase subunit IV [Sphingomonadaceae]QDK32335.1 aa3-type cytochrome c oxidase subunit IV [Sphingomonas sp. IC081]QSR18756.1 aa3-type cytochrome c oxidase subunit IV [Novosphingobium sp. KA1]
MASGTDIKAATETYNSFIKATVWGTAVVLVIVVLVVGLIAS